MLSSISALIFSIGLQNFSTLELCSELETRGGVPVMIATRGESAFSLDSTFVKIEDFLDPMQKLGYIVQQSDALTIRRTTLPESKWGVIRSLIGNTSLPTLKFESIPAKAVSGSKLTFVSANKTYLDIRTIADLPFERPINVSPYFSGEQSPAFFLTMSASKGVTELEFARALSIAMGGRLSISEKSLSVDFDASSFRLGAYKLIDTATKTVIEGKPLVATAESPNIRIESTNSPPLIRRSKETKLAALKLLSQSLNDLNNKILEQTFAFPNTTTRLNLNGFQNLKSLIGSYVRSIIGNTNEQPSALRRGDESIPPNLLNRIDPKNPGELLISTDFRVSVELNVLRSSNNNRDREDKVVLQIL